MSVRNVSDRVQSFVPPTVAQSTQATQSSAQTPRARSSDASSFSTASNRAPVALGAPQRQGIRVGEFNPAAAGPLELDSAAGKAAVKQSLDFLRRQAGVAGTDPARGLKAVAVERDQLGMTHVRFARVHEGLKVFGEQMIAHIGADGKVAGTTGQFNTIPHGLGKQEPKLTAEQALAMATKEFGLKPEGKPTVEKVIVQGEDGQYKTAWRVELTNLHDSGRPQKMNYLIDTQSGAKMDSWNQLGGIELPKSKLEGEGNTVEITKTATPNAKIEDLSSVESTIDVDNDDVTLDQLKLNLDINHTWKGDLKISLTSPSGKTVVVQDRQGGSADDVKGDFDLSTAFAGESVKGQWKLTVEDKARLDTGTLNSWSLDIKGHGKQPPPPPPPPPPGGADDTTLYSGKVQIDATQNQDGTWSLNDTSRGNGVETRDAHNKSSATGSTAFSDANNVWGEETDDPRSKAAVDAQYGAQMTYDFYRDVLGRNSIDGKGEKLVNNVHINTNYVNAYWDGKQMNYGDGDGKQSGPLTTLDIAGHEITHGLTERTAGLVYRGESGGINEAMSDIMGTGVEWYASQKNSNVQFDWMLGEDAWTPGKAGDALRYMDDPTKDGYSIDHYSNYPKQTEVHGSSGIMNNAFYLLTSGGTNRTSKITVDGGIGMEKGLKIYGRALQFYMTSNTNFAGARDACIKAATDLYGADSVEVQKVKDSWHAVGVG